VRAIRGFSQAAQMDDLQCFVRGFHTKHVADVQKLAKVGDFFILCAQCSVRCAKTFSVGEKKGKWLKSSEQSRILP
jgi:hypothetical protein